MRIDLPDPAGFAPLLEAVTGTSLKTPLSGVATDSRECRAGDLYVALVGQQVDGHQFLPQAFSAGAAAALVSKASGSAPGREIRVPEPVAALGQVAARWRRKYPVPLLGITGSNGKTFTKDLLRHLLAPRYRIHATEGNYNTSIGLPLSLLGLTAEVTLAILEMGANQEGDVATLCDIAAPTHGLITNIAPAHLEGFGSLEAVARTKQALFDALPDGLAFVNRDDSWIRRMSLAGPAVTYGLTPDCDFPADLDKEADGTLTLTIAAEEVPTGSRNPSFAKNVIAAAVVARTLNLDWDTFRSRLKTFQPPPGRCQVKRFRDITLIDDTYNANLESTLAAIDYLTTFSGPGRRILVFGDMFELGTYAQEQHRQVGEKCLQAGLQVVLTVGPETRTTDAVLNATTYHHHYDSKEELSVALADLLQKEDKVLVKGSRGMAMETIVEALREA